MARPPDFANWPWDYAWWFLQSNKEGPGRARISHLDSGQWWDIHVTNVDQIAQRHMQDRESKTGQNLRMQDGQLREVPYKALDEEADLLMARAMQPSPDRSELRIIFKDGTPMEKFPRDFWEQLAAQHIERRKAEPTVQLNLGNNQQITVPYIWFDSFCKDFMRRRGDLVAIGWWPELLQKDYGQHAEGPKPVDGRANAMGWGAPVMDGQTPGQGAPPQAPAAPVHPSLEQQELA